MNKCPCCSCKEIVDDYYVRAIGVTFLRCRGCGLRYAKDKTWYQKYKEYNYPEGSTADLEAEALFIRFQAIIKSQQKCLTNRQFSVLDIGCGNGQFLNKVKQTYNDCVSCVGIDPAQTGRSDIDCEFIRDYFSRSAVGNRTFDVITIFGNLMLHEDPFKTLSEARELLNSNGLLIFNVKNSDCSARILLRTACRLAPGVMPDSVMTAAFHGTRFQFNKSVLMHFFSDLGVQHEIVTSPPRSQVVESEAAHSKGLYRYFVSAFNWLDKLRNQQAWIECVIRA